MNKKKNMITYQINVFSAATGKHPLCSKPEGHRDLICEYVCVQTGKLHIYCVLCQSFFLEANPAIEPCQLQLLARTFHRMLLSLHLAYPFRRTTLPNDVGAVGFSANDLLRRRTHQNCTNYNYLIYYTTILT